MKTNVLKKNHKVYIFKHQQVQSGGGGGGSDLENNHQTTINVSTYTEPVEVTPTQGKDGMEKVTVSLSNIPAGANMLYCWGDFYFPFTVAPANLEEFKGYKAVAGDEGGVHIYDLSYITTYTKVSDTEFTWELYAEITSTRDSDRDLEIWNAPPEVETTKQATIDVSTYDPANKPVITPTAGKQSMGSVEVTLENIGLIGFVKVEDNQGRGEYAIARLPITVGQTIWDYLTGGTAIITYISEENHYFDVDGLEGEYILP